MKVSSIQNYNINNKRSKASFKGITNPKNLDDYTKLIAENSGPFANMLSKLKDGEVLNILVTAFGTAIVAPIFIAFNPLSKKDKETKMYSALRQPISAAIAVGAQLGVVKTYNNYLDKLASTDAIDNMRLKGAPKESYLKRLLRMKNPNISNDNIKAQIKIMQEDAMREAIKKNTELLKDKKTGEILTEDMISVKDFVSKKDSLIKAFQKRFKEGKETITLKEYKKSLKPEFIVQEKLKDILAEVEEAAKKAGGNYEDSLRSETIKQFTKSQIAKANDTLSSLKKYGGIVLSLLTLPLTCGLLNWAYPRIVEKFFPKLANSKKAHHPAPPCDKPKNKIKEVA